jgi:sugar phosphate isomerase/epimerase
MPFSKMPALVMHVNYCEQGQTLDEIFTKAAAWGFDGVELRRRWAGLRDDEYIDAIAKARAKSGLREIIFGAPGADLMGNDADFRRREIETAKDFHRQAAQRLGTTLFNTFSGSLHNAEAAPLEFSRHGSAMASEAQWQAAIEGFQELAADAQEIGVRLGFETHASYLHDLPEPAKRLLDAIGSPQVGVTLDYANIALFPNAPSLAETIRLLGEKIFFVHLKNLYFLEGGAYVMTGLGEGAINHREFLRLLQEIEYSGPLCIEAPRAGDREHFAQEDLGYLRTLLRDLDSR